MSKKISKKEQRELFMRSIDNFRETEETLPISKDVKDIVRIILDSTKLMYRQAEKGHCAEFVMMGEMIEDATAICNFKGIR